MILIKENENNVRYYWDPLMGGLPRINKFELFIDDEYVDADINPKKSELENKVKYDITANSFEAGKTLLLQNIYKFPDLYRLSFPIDINVSEVTSRISISPNDENIGLFKTELIIKPYYSFYISYEILHFSKNAEYVGLDFRFLTEDFEKDCISITTDLKISSQILREELSSFLAKIQKSIKATVRKKTRELKTESIVNHFGFPQELKNACEQYLLYFAQFLRDLGINATSDLKEEAGKVLFSVTPTDDIEALDKIREALAVYLNLPASPIVYDDSFAAMRLQQQIENLQHSQRMAVRELQFNEKLLIVQSDTIHEKNITISQQQSVIENQNKIIEKISSKSIMMDSVQNKEELEELYDGLKIGESKFLKEQLGIHLNPAKVIKTAVKNTFGKNEKKSVLGLDESGQEDS